MVPFVTTLLFCALSLDPTSPGQAASGRTNAKDGTGLAGNGHPGRSDYTSVIERLRATCRPSWPGTRCRVSRWPSWTTSAWPGPGDSVSRTDTGSSGSQRIHASASSRSPRLTPQRPS